MQAEEFRHEIRSMIRDEIERTNPNPFTRSLGNPDPIKNSGNYISFSLLSYNLYSCLIQCYPILYLSKMTND